MPISRSSVRAIRHRVSKAMRQVAKAVGPRGEAPPILVAQDAESTIVDSYWNHHTVNSRPFESARESEEYLEGRNAGYPFLTELMDLYADRTGEVVLDYGCGPGDDVVGFAMRSHPHKVIGMDVSETALGLLRERLALYRTNPATVELIRIRDSTGRIPLPDGSVDWVHCGGVLHHTTHPHEIVNEFHRVMKPGARGRLMLYNRDSIWYHLWVAYARRIVDDAYPGLTVDQAFTKSTDGPDCPISDAWPPARVLEMLSDASLQGNFRGGYFNAMELDWLKTYGDRARSDSRLEAEHRDFVSELQPDERGYPLYRGKYAGIGGVYTITKPA